MNAQEITFTEAEVYAERLVQKDILNKKGKDALLQAIKKKSIEVEHPSKVNATSYTNTRLTKETILQFCAAAFSGEQINRLTKSIIEQQIKPEDSLIRKQWVLGGFGMGRGGIDGYISPKRSTIGYTRSRTLEDFKEMALINDMVYQDCKQALLDSTVQDEAELTELMLNRSIYYRYYDFNLKEQKGYIDKLFSIGIISNEGKEKLINSYSRYELKTIPQMLSYSNRYILVELSDYKPDPDITYPVIFQAVQTLLPDFRYQDLKIERIEEKESDLVRIDLKLTFKIGTGVYKHIFFHDYRKQAPDTISMEKPPAHVDQDFHKGINKWLTDIESTYRLYTLNLPEKGEGYYGGKRVGLLLLKQGEAELINSSC